MSDYVTLIGHEDVARAGSAMRSASAEMSRAASSLEDSLYRHRQFLDDWLIRFEALLKQSPQEASEA